MTNQEWLRSRGWPRPGKLIGTMPTRPIYVTQTSKLSEAISTAASLAVLASAAFLFGRWLRQHKVIEGKPDENPYVKGAFILAS